MFSLPHTLQLLSLLPLSVPLPSLQHQDSHQDQGENSVTRSQHPQAIISTERDLLPGLDARDADGQFALDELAVIGAAADDAQTLDDVGQVDNNAAHVEHEAGAVEQRVRLRRPVQLDEEAQEPDADDDVQDARNDGRRCVQEREVRFEHGEVRGRRWRCGPEERVVVGEEREEDAEEEGRCCGLGVR